MSSRVVGLAGQIGSGKSSVARGLADALSCPVASFGDCVRGIARERGVDPVRENLQAIGQELLEMLGPASFIDRVLEGSRWDRRGSLVVEGIRHRTVAETLPSRVQPIPFFLVYLEVPDPLRRSRAITRDALSPGVLSQLEQHPTEREVRYAVRDLADVVISADADVAGTVASVTRAIASLDSQATQ